jgi:ATP-dependent RNA helicase SUPV3L1/SUV3
MQKASLARRHALIAEAQALGAAPTLRVDAVKALQQRWQEEAHAVVLDRKQEQKLWDAFRQPIDEAFARKSSVREQSQAALTPHDKAVLDAAKALDSATAKGDVAAIRAAMQALEQIARGEVVASAAAPVAVEPVAKPSHEAPATSEAADAPAEVSAEASSTDAAEGTQEAPVTQDSNAEVSAEPVAEAAPVKPKAAPRPVVAVRGDDRPGQKRTEVAPAGRGRDGKPGGKFGDKPGFGRDGKPGRDGGREGFAPRGPRLGDAAFRAQRHALESAQDALRRLASQAHGEVLTQLMHAWEKRDAAQVPAAQAIGSKLNPAQRTQWAQAVSAEPKGEVVTPLLRLEVAADLPTPAAHMDARRALQLQMLTRRNDPSPQMTWAADAAQVLGGAYDEAVARRLQSALKVLLKR